eukprot:TRINITY_DN53124_c0_g1_i1.p1 TRINITY_DN53124_c0_g1~~TRINITY_DN53124_c0_g1_i1.p1  ORF type:complete len:473 (+),score=116.53 TRINITY_DN53124_c0_g1_i1:36-1421(+)
MQLPGDLRLLSFPCVLVASGLQYLHFAKKPMAAPLHRISERCARRFLLVGLVAELVALRLLPLCAVYPMNSSLLVLLYFCKETKRARAVQTNEVLACLSAFSAWGLPYVDPGAGLWQNEIQVGLLFDLLLAPSTCAYIVSLLLLGGLICCCSCLSGRESIWASCLPPALNFGVSALLLKAVVQTSSSLLAAPWRTELWAALPVLVVLIAGVRSAASMPLRRALEAHDNLTVLAFYGAMSGAAAMLSGVLIYSELADWGRERQLLFAAIVVAHCWGMRSLSFGDAEPRGSAPAQKAKSEDEGSTRRQKLQSGERDILNCDDALQMVELAGRAVSSTAGKTGDSGPLLPFAEPTHRRTVDDDAFIEEQLFAKALGAAGDTEAEPQFDADFEEIMRRFDEDDRAVALPITELALESFDDSPPPTPQVPDGSPAPQVLAFDAQELLSIPEPDDEDELLKGIEDIP